MEGEKRSKVTRRRSDTRSKSRAFTISKWGHRLKESAPYRRASGWSRNHDCLCQSQLKNSRIINSWFI